MILILTIDSGLYYKCILCINMMELSCGNDVKDMNACGVYGGAGYLKFVLHKTLFLRGICICGLYAYAGYMRENEVCVK